MPPREANQGTEAGASSATETPPEADPDLGLPQGARRQPEDTPQGDTQGKDGTENATGPKLPTMRNTTKPGNTQHHPPITLEAQSGRPKHETPFPLYRAFL